MCDFLPVATVFAESVSETLRKIGNSESPVSLANSISSVLVVGFGN